MSSSYSDSNKVMRVNYLTQDLYDELLGQDLIEDDEIYFTDEQGINANGHTISNVLSPYEDNDAATKGYVDTLFANHNSSSTAHPDIREDLTLHYQLLSNLTTTITASSTNTQYPSAKAVYDLVGNLGSILDDINGEVI